MREAQVADTAQNLGCRPLLHSGSAITVSESVQKPICRTNLQSRILPKSLANKDFFA
jgi:hypothetical protein